VSGTIAGILPLPGPLIPLPPAGTFCFEEFRGPQALFFQMKSAKGPFGKSCPAAPVLLPCKYLKSVETKSRAKNEVGRIEGLEFLPRLETCSAPGTAGKKKKKKVLCFLLVVAERAQGKLAALLQVHGT